MEGSGQELLRNKNCQEVANSVSIYIFNSCRYAEICILDIAYLPGQNTKCEITIHFLIIKT